MRKSARIQAPVVEHSSETPLYMSSIAFVMSHGARGFSTNSLHQWIQPDLPERSVFRLVASAGGLRDELMTLNHEGLEKSS